MLPDYKKKEDYEDGFPGHVLGKRWCVLIVIPMHIIALGFLFLRKIYPYVHIFIFCAPFLYLLSLSPVVIMLLQWLPHCVKYTDNLLNQIHQCLTSSPPFYHCRRATGVSKGPISGCGSGVKIKIQTVMGSRFYQDKSLDKRVIIVGNLKIIALVHKILPPKWISEDPGRHECTAYDCNPRTPLLLRCMNSFVLGGLGCLLSNEKKTCWSTCLCSPPFSCGRNDSEGEVGTLPSYSEAPCKI